MNMRLITVSANPDSFNWLFIDFATNMPGMVPQSIIIPSLKSTLPIPLCLTMFIMAEPMTTLSPVPTANRGGTPRTNSPLVIRNPPPTPKNPPKIPIMTPRSISITGSRAIAALGKNT